jgi:cob(I)alamin adenosyltransferase
MTPFYTAKGDTGDTGILGPGRVSKTSTRIEAVGSVDEATAALGLARSLSPNDETKRIILTIQKTLYLLMSEISADIDVADQFDKLSKQDIDWLEAEIANLEKVIDLPREFIIPGVTPPSSALSLARTIIRRAERRVIALFEEGGFTNELLIAYLNRLSSLIFVLEIYEIQNAGKTVQLAKES